MNATLELPGELRSERSEPGDSAAGRPLRVLYSFPHKLGDDRICHTAWQQVCGLADAGAHLTACVGSAIKAVPRPTRMVRTLSVGKLRLPFKIVGTRRACALHDFFVSLHLKRMSDQIDVVHAWPMGSLRTLRMARSLGIPTFLERPNAHTRFAYDVVQKECQKLGIVMPEGHEHAFKADWLAIEEAEYDLADYLLCPSDFVARTFLDRGFFPSRIARHQYGFDENSFQPPSSGTQNNSGRFTMLFCGGCAPRKGLHYALEAWLKSKAHSDGIFLIAGGFIAGYAEKLAPMLSHPSVKHLGHRTDVPELMRQADVLVLPSIEEGSALVTSEARGSGCVLLVSEASGAVCEHKKNALVHQVGDVPALSDHISLLSENRTLLAQLRQASLETVSELTWRFAGQRLEQVYRNALWLAPRNKKQ